jgi:hypothetical protein
MSGPAPIAHEPKILTDWPEGPLFPNSKHQIRIRVSKKLDWVRISFDFKNECAWVTGPGKVPDKNEFVRKFDESDAREIIVTLGVRPADRKLDEPIALYAFDRGGRQIGESIATLAITPQPEPPPVVRQARQTLRWIVGVNPGKSLSRRLIGIAARVAALGVLIGIPVAGSHYWKTPDPITHLKMDLGLTPRPFVRAADPNRKVRDEVQEFLINKADPGRVPRMWGLPKAWTIVPSGGSDQIDGKLRLVGPGKATFPTPGGTFYDFDLLIGARMPSGGSAVWTVRAQPDGERGYRFTLANLALPNDKPRLYLTVEAVGSGFFHRANRELLHEGLVPLKTAVACCSLTDLVTFRLRAQGFKFTCDVTVNDEDRAPVAPIEDQAEEFPYGAFQILQLAGGPGPEYEFVRVLSAGPR